MKAWLMKGYDGIDGMEFRNDVERPKPGQGEVLLRLHFASLNPADNYLAIKMYPARPEFPHILGRDGAGTVVEVGPGVTKFKENDIVAILRGEVGVSRWGTFAEYAAVPEDLLIPVPNGWKAEEAAAAPLVFLTAYQALTQWGKFDTPGTLLITGASGGVGLACVMLGKALGHRVIGLSRSEEKSKEVVRLGADLMLNPNDPDLVKKVKDFAKKEGVQIAVDNIGGNGFMKLVATLGHNGAVSCVGRLAGPVPEFNTAALFFNRLRIGGVSVGTYNSTEAQEIWKEILELLARIKQKPVVDNVYTLEELPKAFKRLAEGPMGKVLVKCGD